MSAAGTRHRLEEQHRPDPGADAGRPGRSEAPVGPQVVRELPRRVLVLLVRAWQLVVSPWYPPVCRFYPSCSAYAVEALHEHGGARGSALAVRRLLRCHPWNPGGVDHVPARQRHPGAGGRSG